MDDVISYEGIDEAELLVALYHGTKPLGMGWLHNNDGFSVDDARKYVEHATKHAHNGKAWFDYVAGRPVKVAFDTLLKNIERVDLYDRDAGEGACKRVVDGLRAKVKAA
jgi:hypothetical protein